MTFVFWQGILSIHQKSFLEAVAAQAAVSRVLLVVEQDITDYRKSMGWEVPEFINVTVVRSPSQSEIVKIVAEHRDAIHIMGGIRVGEMLSVAFDECAKRGCKLGVMTEPYDSAGVKGMLRTLKYTTYRVRYFKHIQFVLAIGRQGEEQYASLGFDKERIFPWGYFISVPTEQRSEHASQTHRIIYAGRLEAAKGIKRFMEVLLEAERKNYTLDVYGTGDDELAMKELVAKKGMNDVIRFYPFLKHDELLKKYAQYNWVVLPSAGKDGWGVIVSEGLLNGLKAICSDICGVSRVIKDGVNGKVFSWVEEGGCSQAIVAMLDNNGYEKPEEIASWARQGISAGAGAAYLMDVVDTVYENKLKPRAPWEEA